jgi:hypothetical protein
MPAGTAQLILKVVADTKAAAGQVAATQKQVGGFKGALAGVGGVMAGAFAVGAVVAFGSELVSTASDAQQAAGAVETVFGDAADEITTMSEAAAEGAGLAASEYQELAAVIGTQLKAKGIENVAGQTDELIGIGADLAATFGGTTTDAVSALGATLRGEFDTAERFGLSLSANAVAAKAVEMGLAKSTSEVDANAKATATLALITEQTADAQGAFARETDTVAGSAAVMSAKWTNVKTKLGNVLIPMVAKVITWISDLIDLVVTGIPAMWRKIKPVIETIGRVFRAIFGGIAAYIKVWVAVIRAYIKSVIDVFRGIIEFVRAVFRGDWQAAFQAIKGIFTNIWGNIKDVIKSLPGSLGGIVTGLGRAALDAGEAIVNGILDGLGAAGGAVADFASSVGDAFRNFINDHVIGPIKEFSFTIDAGPFHHTFVPFGALPYLAKGGIVTGPTLAMIGERGPEAVIPLNRGGIGPTYNITVQAGVGDPVRIGQTVVETITAYERVNGRRWRDVG